LVVLLAAVACAPADDDRPKVGDLGDQPGGSVWHDGEDVTCATTDDCVSGEACEDGVCRMARCQQTYDSASPLGGHRYFGTDGELLVVGEESFIDAFEPLDDYLSSWNLEDAGGAVLDVTGGDLTGARPHVVAAAVAFSQHVLLFGDGELEPVDVGIWPTAVAAGDVDADGVDELVSFSEDGVVSVCSVDTRTCTIATTAVDGFTGTDLAVADVDGDGYAEPVLLFTNEGESTLLVWHTELEQDNVDGYTLELPTTAIDAGDLNGDGVAEVVALEDGGWWDWVDDKLHIMTLDTEEPTLTSSDVSGRALDIAIGDRDSDELSELAVLGNNKTVELFSGSDGPLSSLGTASVNVGESSTRISFADWDGDSASGELIEGPELVAGESVPLAVMVFPPYPHNVAKGALSAKVGLGASESSTESVTDTVSLSVGLGISFGVETGIFKAKVGASLEKSISLGQTTSMTTAVGARYSMHAQPDHFSRSYAGVILTCGCYHRYRYRTEDPQGLIGGSDQQVDFYVPVGGQTQLWSTTRYNALADATAELPTITVPILVGNVNSYPTAPQTLDGQPIGQDELLFSDPPLIQSSDVGYVEYYMTNGDSETNSFTESTTLGIQSSLGAGGVSVDSSINLGFSQGYSIQVGKSSRFTGAIPPIPDDAATPEDEYLVHRYAFTPIIYRHHYEDQYGDPGAYIVIYAALGDH